MRPRERRALVGGAAFIVGSVLVSRGFPMLAAAESTARARLEYARDRAARVDDAWTSVHRRKQLQLDPTARLEFESQFLEAASITEATGALVQLVAGLTEFAGGRITMTSPASDTSFADGVARVRIRVSLHTDSQGLLALLRELEVGPRLLVVSHLSVTQSEPTAGPSQPESLRVDMTIVGLVRRDVAPTTDTLRSTAG